ncbi:MAG: type II toxin-antitoxin system HicA family toxin [Acidobacteria bacterium]|nr:type II toxin-antitoxin system HicA family toxin [Acidobacteriota bacterium]
MARLVPISVKDLIKRLRKFGWEGPVRSGRHHTLAKGTDTLTVPNPHRADISVGMVRRILAQAGISVEDWLAAG